MKKNIFLFSLFLCYSQLFTFNQIDYQKLIQGEKNLIGADLQNIEIKDLNLTDVDFTKANLRGAKLNNVILTNVTFNNTKLDGDKNNHTKFSDTIFRNSKILNGTMFDWVEFNNTTFDNTEIKDSSFYHSKFINSDFLLSNIQKVSMELIETQKLGFISCSSLKDIKFNESKLKNILILNSNKIIGTQLNFSKAVLINCCFLGKKIREKQACNDGNKYVEPLSSLSQSIFYGTYINNCFFSEIHFDNCQQICELSNGSTSILQNVSASNPADLESFIAKGAKVNGSYGGAYEKIWDEKNQEEAFFVEIIKSFGLGVASRLVPELIVTGALYFCCIQ